MLLGYIYEIFEESTRVVEQMKKVVGEKELG